MKLQVNKIISDLHYDKKHTVGSTVFVPIIGQLDNVSEGIHIADETIDGIRVSELEQEQVNVVNIGSTYQGSVLVLAGMILMGGRQTRTPVRPFIIQNGGKAQIPVNCIEQGRWEYTAKDAVDEDQSMFKVSKQMVSRKTKSSYMSGGETQSATWGNISSYMAENALDDDFAPTQSYVAVEGAVRKKEKEKLDMLRNQIENVFKLPSQRGIAIFEKGELVSIEAFDNPEYWVSVNSHILESNLLDLLSSEKEEEVDISQIDFDPLQISEADSIVNEASFKLQLNDLQGWGVGLEDQIVYSTLSKFEGKEQSQGHFQVQQQMNIEPEYFEQQEFIDDEE